VFASGLPSAPHAGFLANQDFVWGVGLILSGAFVASAIIRCGPTAMRTTMLEGSVADWDPGRPWEWLIGRLVPLQAVVLLGWWLYQAAAVYAPATSYNPSEPYSVMTCLVQWGAALILFVALNRHMARRTLGRAGSLRSKRPD